MAASKTVSSSRRRGRRWSFADCVFDEDSWSLLVGGRRSPVEAKPMELLHELLLHAGKVVSKDELLDRIWPNVIVVEASLPTAVRKLRLALADDQRDQPIVETVSGIGYRIAVAVDVVERVPEVPAAVRRGLGSDGGRPAGGGLHPRHAWTMAFAVAVALLGVEFASSQQSRTSPETGMVSQKEAGNALRRLDVQAVEEMLAAGWNPNTPFDGEGNGAINYLLNMCEWDRGHDRRKMLLMVRTLYDAGGAIDRPNFWGDTAYSIAKAPRYCGPDHPVTEMLRTMCYAGPGTAGDRCLATYELARRDRH
ncbi:MAG TPA: winged helix-turn-helix domain-containing protein [Allosphingosinicella sp.]|nr:winged helix-turn-helix domain-containing protein [Allosphingosinicella sp.]